MKITIIWKNILLVTIGSLLALHMQMINSSDDYMIMDDQYERIH